MGYLEDNRRMIVDCLFFMIADMLKARRIPYVSKQDMTEQPFMTLFNGDIPELIVKSGGPFSKRPKPQIVDSLAGLQKRKQDEIRHMYNSLSCTFDAIVFKVYDYNLALEKLFDEIDVEYLDKQVGFFVTAYANWHACIAGKTVLKLDSDECGISPVKDASPEFVSDQALFKSNLILKASQLK